MQPSRIPAAMRFSLSLAGVVLALTAARTFAADDENGLLVSRPTICECGSLLHRLLTWPKKDEGDEEKEGNKQKEAGKKKDDDEKKDEEEPLESDRPDFTDSSTTVGYQKFQVESGYTFTHAVAGDSTHDAHDLPELLVRYGVAERLELRVAWDEGMVFERYVDRTSGRVVTNNGSTDMNFGCKFAISKQDK